jgi:hypothetical protein
MKKNFKLSIAFVALVGFALTSCSNEPKLMTEAEFSKKVAEATNAKTSALEAELNQKCETTMDAQVNALVDSIVLAKQAELAQ